jgi:hypothetical protein
LFTLTDITVRIQLTNFDLQSSIRLITLCRGREINVLGSQTKVQKATRQPHLLANTNADIIQSNDTPKTKHKNNGGEDQPPIAPTSPIVTTPPSIPHITFIEMLTVRSSVTTIVQTVHRSKRYTHFSNTKRTANYQNHSDSTLTTMRHCHNSLFLAFYSGFDIFRNAVLTL